MSNHTTPRSSAAPTIRSAAAGVPVIARRPHFRVPLAVLGAAVAALTVARPARAHTAGISTAEFVLDPAPGPDGGVTVSGRLVFARGEIEGPLSLDRNRNGVVEASDLEAASADLRKLVEGGVEVTAGADVCRGELRSSALVEGDGLELEGRWTCPRQGPRSLAVTMFLLSDLRPGHRQLVRIIAGSNTTQKVLTDTTRLVKLDLPGPPPAKPARGGAAVVALASAFVVVFAALFVWRHRRGGRKGVTPK